MNEEVKNFIKNNVDLINEDTKESWEEIYKKLYKKYSTITGEFTQTMFHVGIDPAKKLDCLPPFYLYRASIEEYNIPNNITNIKTFAFNKSSLRYINIPNSVIYIKDRAFEDCVSLTDIIIPNNVIDISDFAFYNCNSLISVIIKSKNIKINNKRYIFGGCPKLTSIKFEGTKEDAMNTGIGRKSCINWREGSPIEKIICTDGEIEL